MTPHILLVGNYPPDRQESMLRFTDMLRDGLTQRQVAERLGVSDQAVSARVRAADVRAELAARPALDRLLGEADVRSAQVPA